MPNLYKINMLKAIGKQKDSSGSTAYLTPTVLRELAETYSPDTYEAQIVIGHNDDLKAMLKGDKAPSFGYIKSVHLENNGTELWGIVDLIDEAHDWVKRGLYKHVSLAYYEPGNPYGVLDGKHYIRHLALLGATPPAIKGLDRFIKLSEDNEMVKQQTKALQEGEVLEVEAPMQEDNGVIDAPSLDAPPEEIEAFMDENAEDFLANMLLEGEFGFRGDIVSFDPVPSKENNYLMDESGMIKGTFTDEEGEQYMFEVSGNSKSFQPVNTEEEGEEDMTEVVSEQEEDQLSTLMQQFSEYACGCDKGMDDYSYKMPNGKTIIIKIMGDDEMGSYEEPLMEEPMMEEEEDEMSMSPAAMAEIAALKEQLNSLREADKKRRYAELEAFCEGLYSDGRLLETVTPKQEVLAFMESLDSQGMLAFSEEKEEKPLDWFKSILSLLPVQLPMSDMTALAEEPVASVKFKAPSNMGVDQKQLKVYSEAKALSEKENIPFSEALTRLSV